MTHTFSFEKLSVWQDAMSLSVLIYSSTKLYPDEEKFGLISQMRRCAISICSNIAEGASRKTKKDQAHFYTMAFGSLMELLNQCIISRELTFIDENQYHDLRHKIEGIGYKLNSLRNSAMKS